MSTLPTTISLPNAGRSELCRVVVWQSAAARRKFSLERLRHELAGTALVWENPNETGDPTLELARDALAMAEVLVAGWGCQTLPTGLYAAAPKLRLACLLGSSVKPLRPEEAWAHGVALCNTAAAVAEGVAEYTLGAILLWLHKHDYYDRGMKSGADWHQMKAGRTQRNLCDTTVGLVGGGLVGSKLGARLRRLGARVRVFDPYIAVERLRAAGFDPVESLEELLSGSDIVSLHAGATPGTNHMIGSAGLRLLRDGALFVNTARAALVDEAALVAELSSGRLDAFLDVFAVEPLPADHALRRLPNVHLAPHAAASSNSTVHRLNVDTVIETIRRVGQGAIPVSIVTPEMYARMT